MIHNKRPPEEYFGNGNELALDLFYLYLRDELDIEYINYAHQIHRKHTGENDLRFLKDSNIDKNPMRDLIQLDIDWENHLMIEKTEAILFSQSVEINISRYHHENHEEIRQECLDDAIYLFYDEFEMTIIRLIVGYSNAADYYLGLFAFLNESPEILEGVRINNRRELYLFEDGSLIVRKFHRYFSGYTIYPKGLDYLLRIRADALSETNPDFKRIWAAASGQDIGYVIDSMLPGRKKQSLAICL